MDVHVRRAVTMALRLRAVDVLTSQEDGSAEWDDERLLMRATALSRVLVSQDQDLLRGSEVDTRGPHLLRHHLCAPASDHDWTDGGRSRNDRQGDLSGRMVGQDRISPVGMILRDFGAQTLLPPLTSAADRRPFPECPAGPETARWWRGRDPSNPVIPRPLSYPGSLPPPG